MGMLYVVFVLVEQHTHTHAHKRIHIHIHSIMEHQVYSAAVKLAKKKKSEHKPIVKDEL